MSNKDNVITLPKITIEESSYEQVMNASNWWCNGFMTGFNTPDTTGGWPLLINDELVASFIAGLESGQHARKDIEAELDERYRNSPQVVSDIGREAYEEVQRHFNKAWKSFFHEHMPHTEVGGQPSSVRTSSSSPSDRYSGMGQFSVVHVLRAHLHDKGVRLLFQLLTAL
jgi:hypothetical protein